ncbi:MAG: SDR family oxidoreductase [Alphaproteobacteria bacterium]|nr:SDR family oxidoreductase [Alphaproteobacteria bacterium]
MSALFRLDGCSAFVSGAAGHLGREMSAALCEAGAHVILNGRDESRLKDFAGEMRAQNHSVDVAAFDVADSERVRHFFGRIERLDVLVNNAVSMTPRPFDELSVADFAVTYASAVSAAFEAVRAARPALERAAQLRGEASVVNVASMYGLVAPDARLYADAAQQSPFHYGPAKAALLQLTRHLAAELGRQRIRVNALVPGPFPKGAVAAGDSDFVRRLSEKTMLGRIGSAVEIRGPLLFLAAPASSFVTGAALRTDGGWTAW